MRAFLGSATLLASVGIQVVAGLGTVTIINNCDFDVTYISRPPSNTGVTGSIPTASPTAIFPITAYSAGDSILINGGFEQPGCPYSDADLNGPNALKQIQLENYVQADGSQIWNDLSLVQNGGNNKYSKMLPAGFPTLDNVYDNSRNCYNYSYTAWTAAGTLHSQQPKSHPYFCSFDDANAMNNYFDTEVHFRFELCPNPNQVNPHDDIGHSPCSTYGPSLINKITPHTYRGEVAAAAPPAATTLVPSVTAAPVPVVPTPATSAAAQIASPAQHNNVIKVADVAPAASSNQAPAATSSPVTVIHTVVVTEVKTAIVMETAVVGHGKRHLHRHMAH